MDLEACFPRINPDVELKGLPILEVDKITSVETSTSRIAVKFMVETNSLVKNFKSFDTSDDKVELSTSHLLLHVKETDSYYYMKSLYNALFPWLSQKGKFYSISICSDIKDVGDVTRIFNIDRILDMV